MIGIAAIESALELLEEEQAVEEAMVEFAAEQAAFVQYLSHETFDLLTEDERGYLQYLVLVMWTSVKTECGNLQPLRGDIIERWEEQCWTWLEATVGKPMSQRLDLFFEEIDQEELLAFAEDSLVDPDADTDGSGEDVALFASGPSRELGLVALATFVGCIDELLNEV